MRTVHASVVLLGSCVYLLVSGVAACHAKTWYVDPGGGGDAVTIQEGIDLSVSGDTVLLADAVYTGYGNWDANFLGKAIAVRSASGIPDLCVVDCADTLLPHIGFFMNFGEGLGTLLEGVTVINADPVGVKVDGAFGTVRADIKNCRLSGNTVGMTCEQSNVNVLNSVFTGNVGDGLYFGLDCVALVDSCEFSYNGEDGLAFDETFVIATVMNSHFVGNAGFGATLDLLITSTVTECVFDSNLVGGLALFQCDPVVTSCTFTNTGVAALAGLFARPTFDYCTFARNQGVLDAQNTSPAFFTNCTIVDNAVGTTGAVLACDNFDSSVSIERTIIAFNTGSPMFACPLGGEITVGCSDVFGNAAGDWVGCIAGQETARGNFSKDPYFCGLNQGKYTLAALSDCMPPYNKCLVQIGAHGSGCPTPTAILPRTAGAGALRLSSYPNPFNPATTIEYDVPTSGVVQAAVYDVRGRRVRTVTSSYHDPGHYRATWDGRDERGGEVASGVYLIRLRLGSMQATERVVLLK